MSNKEVLSVQGLSKTYTTFRKEGGFRGSIKSLIKRETIKIDAVRPLDFSIQQGEFVGLLGPNGAGKTTTLKMLTGLVPPTQGRSIAFQAFDTRTRDPSYLKRIGMVMGQRNQLHPDLPAMDSFRLAQAIYGLSENKFIERTRLCFDLFDIAAKVEVPVRKLSLGERMKMELILAILHEPELLFLDEPTIGLDFNAAKQIRSFLKRINKDLGVTVILTSHYTKDIEELCRRVIVINHGSLIYDGALAGLDERFQGERLVKLKPAAPNTLANLFVHLKSLHFPDGVKCLEPRPYEEFLTVVTPSTSLIRTCELLLESLNKTQLKASIRDLLIEERSLEDIFSELYTNKNLPTAESHS